MKCDRTVAVLCVEGEEARRDVGTKGESAKCVCVCALICVCV